MEKARKSYKCLVEITRGREHLEHLGISEITTEMRRKYTRVCQTDIY
jgi:hypothetical protein